MIHESLKEPEKIFTTFDKSLSPVTMITEQEWQDFRIKMRHVDATINDVARAIANACGGSFVELGSGTLTVFTKLSNGDVRETFYNAGTWEWLNDEYK